MARYSEKLNGLWAAQPASLSTIQKLLRIDCLACLELEDDVAFNHNFNANWFFVLMIHLLEAYLTLGLDPTEPLVKEITAHHVYRFQRATILNTDPEGKHQRLLHYTVLRTKLRGLVDDLLGSRSVSKQHRNSGEQREADCSDPAEIPSQID